MVQFSNVTEIHLISADDSQSAALHILVHINGKAVTVEVDTGSDLTIICKQQFINLFPELKLHPADVNLSTLAGPVEVLGAVSVSVNLPGGPVTKMSMTVVKGPLLGAKWLDMLFPEWRKAFRATCFSHAVSDATVYVKKLLEQYPSVFSEDGSSCIKGVEAHIVLKDDATLVFKKAYSVPYA